MKNRDILLAHLKDFRKSGMIKEEFLNDLCKDYGFLMHGSVHKIAGSVLKSPQKKIFATDNAAIAIMRSLYSNKDVNLRYPYVIDADHPLVLEIHTPLNGKFMSVEKGFIYFVDRDGFKNDPKGSWQFVREDGEVGFCAVMETDGNDFTYPVKLSNDL